MSQSLEVFSKKASRQLAQVSDQTAVAVHADNARAVRKHNQNQLDHVTTRQVMGMINALHAERVSFAESELIRAQTLFDHGHQGAARAIASIVAEATRQTGYIAERFTIEHS